MFKIGSSGSFGNVASKFRLDDSLSSKSHEKDLSLQEKWNIVAQVMFFCNPKSLHLNLEPFTIQKVADLLNVSISSVKRVWTEYISQIKEGVIWPKLESPKSRVCGRKSKLNSEIPEAVLHESSKRLKYSAPLRDQVMEIYDATHLKISKSSLHRYLRKNLGYAYGSGYINPLISKVNIKKRLRFILGKVQRRYELDGKTPTNEYRYNELSLY
jgi:hypothetical protein